LLLIFSALRLSQLSGGVFLTPGKACRPAQDPANTGLEARFARVFGAVNGIVFFVYTQGIQKEFNGSAIFPSVFRALRVVEPGKKLSRVDMVMAGFDKSVSSGCHKDLHLHRLSWPHRWQASSHRYGVHRTLWELACQR
jgi:hypothetical protein